MNHDGASVLADSGTYVARVAPQVAVSGMSVAGIPLNEWVYIVTIAYTLLQTAYFVYKLAKKYKNRDKDNGG